MAKKSRRKELQEQEQIKWYQWEFLRRNLEYCRHYELFMATFGEWFRRKGFWYDRSVAYRGKDWSYFCEKICPQACTICQEWLITDPFPPDWKFDKKSGLREYRPRNPFRLRSWGPMERILRQQTGARGDSKRRNRPKCYKYLPTGCSPEQAAALWRPPQDTRGDLPEKAKRALRVLRSRRSRGKGRLRYLEVRFDLTRPPRELLVQARQVIEIGRVRYSFLSAQEERTAEKPPQKRRRLDQYDSYLTVWDLRRLDLKPSEIAQKVGQSGQTVYDYFKAADKLIQGGYKELR